jgi:ribonuclease-3
VTDRQAHVQELISDLGVEVDAELLNQALTHRSFSYENGAAPHNERLEFLGDSVLGIVVTETLFRSFPDLPEGQLAKLRAAVVNARALALLAETLGIGAYLLLGRGEETTGGRQKASILADAMEAIIGAVYLTGGMAGVSAFIHRCVDPMIAASARLGAGLDWKTSLQEAAAGADLGVPEYLVEGVGPDHEKEFTARVRVGGRVLGQGRGRSKKVAEQEAAEEAYLAITARSGGGPEGVIADAETAESTSTN